METMNRAIEDASDFMEMKRKLMQTMESRLAEAVKAAKDDPERLDLEKLTIAPPELQKQPGENREQYRERMRRGRKAAAK